MEHIQDYFDNDTHWDSEKYLNDENENLRISKTRELIPSDVKNIIDVGCGNGFFLKTLEALKLYSLFGIEPSKSAINHNLSSLKIDQGKIENINFQDNFFDLVTCLEVIEHLQYNTYERGLLELERISNKYIMISVPFQENRNHVVCPYCDCYFNGTTHLKSFDENKLFNLFQNSTLINLQKVGKTKEFKFQFLRKFFKRNHLFFRNIHVCPQCNYSTRENSLITHNQKKGINPLFNFLYSEKPIWYIALYEKNIQ